MTDRTPDRMQQDADRTVLSVPEAAERLGVTPDAIRARLHRGTLEGEKEGGAWRVFLPSSAREQAGPTGPQQDETVGQQDGDRQESAAVIARLEAENAYLRQVLDAEIEARRRADHLVAALVERVQALPASVGITDVPQERDPGPLRGDVATEAFDTGVSSSAPQESPIRRWWRRVTGGGAS